MTQKQKSKTREEYIIQIGPLLMKVLKNQMESIKDVTYDCVNPSFYEAGEVVAKKVLGIA